MATPITKAVPATFQFARGAGGRFQSVAKARTGSALIGVPGLRRTVGPYSEAGTSGTAVVGGYVISRERNAKLLGQRKHETAADILANISVVASGVRYFLNLVAKAKYKANPANDSAEAKAVAEFVEEVMGDMTTTWARVVRRAALHRFHGFSIQEWTAKKRPDGQVGIEDVESRPQFTIEQWDVDDGGTVLGMVQRDPLTGQPLYLPRAKVIYCLDDALSDSPEGCGWVRNLAEPAERLKRYLKQEGIGFERDLSGIPIGKAPISAMNAAVKAGTLDAAEAIAMIKVMEDFVTLEVKKEDTAAVFDSATYENVSADGPKPSGVPKWGVEILTGRTESIEALGAAIMREMHDMSRIIGTENLLIGSDGAGSLALSQDKTNNMLLAVNACAEDIAATFGKDYVGPIARLNGIPEYLMPELVSETIQFADVAKMAAFLRDIAAAGAPLQPGDPAVDDMRDAMGLQHAPEMSPEDMGVVVRGPSDGGEMDDEDVNAEEDPADA